MCFSLILSAPMWLQASTYNRAFLLAVNRYPEKGQLIESKYDPPIKQISKLSKNLVYRYVGSSYPSGTEGFTAIERRAIVVLLTLINAFCVTVMMMAGRNQVTQEISVIVSPLSQKNDDLKYAQTQGFQTKDEVYTLQYRINRTAIRCANISRPKESDIKIIDKSWQAHDQEKSSVYIFSSVYDDRPAVGLHPLIRIFVMASYDQAEPPIFCHIWYNGVEEPFIVQATINETGLNRYQFGDRGYREYTLSCPLLVSQPVPTHVSITKVSPCSQKLTTYQPIHYVPRQEPPIEFGVCVTNGYGEHPIHQIVEWIELQRLYGVAELNLYDTMFANMSKVFNYYIDKGLLNVYKIPHPLGLAEKVRDKIRNLRTTALNDCMYRNMYRYRYIVVLDLDEFIVPRRHTNYTVMLDQVDVRRNLTKRFHAYSFQNVYFFREFEQVKNETLRTMRYQYRVNHDQELYGSKSMISPLCCFNLFNHYCLNLLSGFNELTVHVPIVIASNHHYRQCGLSADGCQNRFKEKSLDSVMLRVKSRLKKRVNPVLEELDQKTFMIKS